MRSSPDNSMVKTTNKKKPPLGVRKALFKIDDSKVIAAQAKAAASEKKIKRRSKLLSRSMSMVIFNSNISEQSSDAEKRRGADGPTISIEKLKTRVKFDPLLQKTP